MSEMLKEELPYTKIKVDENLTLRQLNLDEAEHLFELVDQDRVHLGKWLPWVKETLSPKDSEDFIKSKIDERKAGEEYGYGIVYDNEVVGHMSLMHLNDHKDPEIGYWISSKMAGKGITTLATGALTNFGFNTLGLKKIIIKADPENSGSNRVAEKLGYKLLNKQVDEDRISTSNIWVLEKPEDR